MPLIICVILHVYLSIVDLVGVINWWSQNYGAMNKVGEFDGWNGAVMILLAILWGFVKVCHGVCSKNNSDEFKTLKVNDVEGNGILDKN